MAQFQIPNTSKTLCFQREPENSELEPYQPPTYAFSCIRVKSLLPQGKLHKDSEGTKLFKEFAKNLSKICLT